MRKKLIFILLAMFIFVGCRDLALSEEIEIDFINHENYEIVLFIDDGNLQSPNGMAFDGVYIYIADTEHNDVFIYDIQGNYVGRMGNGELEFVNPIAVAISPVDGSIFVADETTGRIQMIQDGVNVRDFFIDGVRYILDIEVDDEQNLYVSVLDFVESFMKIHVFDNQGERMEIGQRQLGVLGRGQNNEILFAQTYEVIDGSTVGSGASFFAQIDNNELIKIADLPDRYTPSTIFSRDNRIYLFSHGMHQLDVFDFDGNYIETIYENEPTEANRGMFYVIPFGSDSFLITDNERGIVYKIRPVES